MELYSREYSSELGMYVNINVYTGISVCHMHFLGLRGQATCLKLCLGQYMDAVVELMVQKEAEIGTSLLYHFIK